MALPDFLVIGAPKAGSTALHAALVQHPQLFLSTPKEPKFFLTGGRPPARSAQRGPGDAHSAREWIWRRDGLRGALRRGAARHADRREHAVLPVGHGGAPPHARAGAEREAHRRHPRSGRARLLELDAPVVRRPRDRAQLPDRVRARAVPRDRRVRAVLALSRARQVRQPAAAPVRGVPARAGARRALPPDRRRAGARRWTRSRSSSACRPA